MRAFWTIFAGLFGAVTGFLAAALFAIHALGDAGTSATEEMMTIMSIAPYGVVLGAISGAWLTLWATRIAKPVNVPEPQR